MKYLGLLRELDPKQIEMHSKFRTIVLLLQTYSENQLEKQSRPNEWTGFRKNRRRKVAFQEKYSETEIGTRWTCDRRKEK